MLLLVGDGGVGGVSCVGGGSSVGAVGVVSAVGVVGGGVGTGVSALLLESLKITISVENMFFIRSPNLDPDKIVPANVLNNDF